MSEMLSLDLDLQLLANTIEYVCRNSIECGPIEYVRKTSDFRMVRFATSSLRSLFPAVKLDDGVWKTKDVILYVAEIGKDCLKVSCCVREKGISSEYKKNIRTLKNSFASDLNESLDGKVILKKWILCSQALDQAVVLKSLQNFISKELLEWENSLYSRLGVFPPHSTEPSTILAASPADYTVECEGEIKEIHSYGFERNLGMRKSCVEYYKKKDGALKCQICGFSFCDFFGAQFEEMIEVHHIEPLCKIRKEHELDPVVDLIPVCSNCHWALHHKQDGVHNPYKPEELKEIIRQTSLKGKH